MQYEIKGGDLPVVVCMVDQNETVITQNGGMAWMSPNMIMETTMGSLAKGLGRVITGEKAFINRYTAKGSGGLIAFASSFPGEIRAFPIRPGEDIILQKTAFLAGSASVNVSVFFQKKLRSALWGGEGFIMQRMSGVGTVFAEFDGSVSEYELGANEQIVIDTGYLAAMSATCKMDIVTVPGVKNVLFGGEGLFNTVVTGPGHVWLQSIPINKLASVISPFLRINRS